MTRIYTEYRIAHKSVEEKILFKKEVKEKAKRLGLTVAGYVKLVALNSQGGITTKDDKGANNG